ncbi:hypothetical protein RFI_24717 [Reticulomyxa filosa]|uniref:Uncharacterized protein n=1 Tax=Reticulomyxa filosa TaxID=46433 RepID=X6MF61_RETFI|nr:hypothetical protein RFI_24717 [Reticulomyxa filosa]|eukprot:ETO12658.1 hypothetical protein RFI_24717 [Reticulomyxa filosa]
MLAVEGEDDHMYSLYHHNNGNNNVNNEAMSTIITIAITTMIAVEKRIIRMVKAITMSIAKFVNKKLRKNSHKTKEAIDSFLNAIFDLTRNEIRALITSYKCNDKNISGITRVYQLPLLTPED